MSAAASIVDAGRGRRLGGPVPKQYRSLGGEMVLTRTLRTALACTGLDVVLVAIHPEAGEMYAAAVATLDAPRLLPPVHGGAERADTVRLALEALESMAPEVVLIHDAARPFASPALYAALADHARSGEGAIAAEPVADALWREVDGLADTPAPPAGLWRAPPPPALPLGALVAAPRPSPPPARPPRPPPASGLPPPRRRDLSQGRAKGTNSRPLRSSSSRTTTATTCAVSKRRAKTSRRRSASMESTRNSCGSCRGRP